MSDNNSRQEEGYRLARKTYMCHVCNREFRQMAPVLELVEVQCPTCNQTFCEEVESQPNSGRNSHRGSRPASPAMQASGPQVAPQQESVDDALLTLLGMPRLHSQRRESPQASEPSNSLGLIITRRRIVTDEQGRQTIIEEVSRNGITQTTVTTMLDLPRAQVERPISAYLLLDPTFLPGNLNLNFRSVFNDESIFQHIMRLSELERGRSGTPPASQAAIDGLKQVDITDEHCKTTETQAKEYPRCSVCCEDLTEKATQMPCGHLFNNECITQWLKQHNQCPVCRYELPTEDADYERSKQQATS